MSNRLDPEPFLITKEHRRFVEFCDACRHYRYIGLCYGAPGVGKTMSARTYAHWALIEPCLQLEPQPHRGPDLPPEDLRTVLYTPTVVNTPKRIQTQIAELRAYLLTFRYAQAHPLPAQGTAAEPLTQRQPRELILVDEADRLAMNGLEEIRDLYDRHDVAVILLGIPGIEKRLARYPQLYSRVGFVHAFKLLNREDIHFVLQHKWQMLGLPFDAEGTDSEAVAALIRITSGNFRLLQRLFSQMERVMQINHLAVITKEVVEAARELLVIGPT